MYCLLLNDTGDLTVCHSSGQVMAGDRPTVPRRLGLWRASGPLARTLEVVPAITELAGSSQNHV